MSSTVPAMKRKQNMNVAGDVIVNGNSVWHAGNLQKSEFTSSSHVGTGGNSHAAVTTTTNGFMIASDKLKLDGIENNAINQLTADARYLKLTGGRITGDLMIDNIGNARLYLNADTDNDTAESGEPILVLTQDSGIVGAEVKLSQGGANDNTLVLAPFMDYNTTSPIKNYNVFIHDKKIWHEGNFLKSEFTPASHMGTGGSSHTAVTTTVNGFMLASDKVKLNGISTGANKVESSTSNGNIKIDGTETTVYTHPSTDGSKHVPAGGVSGQFIKWLATGTGEWTNINWSDIQSRPTSTVGDIDDAVDKRHTQNTDTGTTSSSFVIGSTTDPTLVASVFGLRFGNQWGPYLRISGSGNLLEWYADWGNSGGTRTYGMVKAKGFVNSSGVETSYADHKHTFAEITDKPSTYTPPIATSTVLGGVKQGTNVSIAADGTISGAYSVVSTTTDGLMSTTEHEKLSGISANATETSGSTTNGYIFIDGASTKVYEHPITSGNKHIPSGGAANQYLKYSADGTAIWATVAMDEVSGVISDAQHGTKTTDTLHALATSTGHGFMSKTDKSKLDGIQSSAINQTSADGRYLQLSGGTISGKLTVGSMGLSIGEGLEFLSDNNYFGTNLDARIIRLVDGNDSNGRVDGGLIFQSYSATDAISAELLRIRFDEFQWKGNNIWHAGNFNPANKLDATHLGTGGASHAAVTQSVNGFMIATDKKKLDGISEGATKTQKSTTNGDILIDGVQQTVYAHPLDDGYYHVPATGTTSNGKFLKAGTTAGSFSWQQMNFTDVTGTITNAQHGNRSGGSLHAAVTTTVNGFMIASDKEKLDGIESNAINQTSADNRYLRRGVNEILTGRLEIQSADDGILRLRQMGNIGTVGTKDPAWNYIEFVDSEGDRQSYFGINPGGDMVFNSEITGVVKVGSSAIWHEGNFTPSSKLDATHAGTGGASHALVTTGVHGFMSSDDKTKLNGVSTGATKTADSPDNGYILIDDVSTQVYTHPSGDGNLHVPANGTTNNGKFLKSSAVAGDYSWQQLAFTDVSGIITDAQHGNRSGGTLHSAVTQTTNGFMSAADKAKLDAIEEEANKYIHPSTHSLDMITETAALKVMTAAERTKLSGVADNANNYAHPATHSLSMITETDTLKVMTADERTKLAGIQTSALNQDSADSRYVQQAGDTMTGMLQFDNRANGTFPGAQNGFEWLLSTDGASMYAYEKSTDSTDYVFKLRDNTNASDRFVFWFDDYRGEEYDVYPLIMTGLRADFSVPAYIGGHRIWDAGNLSKSEFTPASHVGTNGDSHAAVTTTVNGFMTAADKVRLNGMEDGANKYIHPSTHGLDMITETDTLKVMTSAERIKLSGIAENANNYTHPSTHSLSMITETTALKIMTAAERTKLSAIEESAINQTSADSRYLQLTGGTLTGPLTAKGITATNLIASTESRLSSGAYVDPHSGINYGLKVSQGIATDKLRVSGSIDVTGTVDGVDVSQLKADFDTHNGSNGSSHAIVTTTVNGFMSAADKVRLNAMEDGANKYIHPSTHSATMIVEDATHRFFTDTERTKLTNIEESANNYTHPDTHAATMIVEDATHRFFTDTERTKLTGIAENANNYVHPSSHSLSMITETTTRKIMTDTERSKLAGIADNANLYVHPASHSLDMITETTSLKVMTAAERTKLSNVAENANNYSHPTGDGSLHVPATSTTNSGKFLKAGATAGSISWQTLAFTDVAGSITDAQHGNRSGGTLHSVVTQSVNGFMSSIDKTKLDGIESSAINQTTADSRYVLKSGDTMGGALSMTSLGATKLTIEADSDNSGEADNPAIELFQDGKIIGSKIGMTADTGANNGMYIQPNATGNAAGSHDLFHFDGVTYSKFWHAGNFTPSSKSDVGHTHTVANITDLATNYYSKTEINTQMSAKGDVFSGRTNTFADTNTFTKAGVALKLQPATAIAGNTVLLQLNNSEGNSLVTMGTNAAGETVAKVVINGDLEVTGATVQKSTQDIQGDMNVTGNLNVTGDAVLGDGLTDQTTVNGDLRLKGRFMPSGRYIETGRLPIFGIADDFQFETTSLSFEDVISSFATFDTNGGSAFEPVTDGAARYYRIMIHYSSSGSDDSVIRIINEADLAEMISFALPAVNAPLDANSGLGSKARTWMSAHFSTEYAGSTIIQAKKNVSGNLAIRYIELIAYDYYA